MAELIEIGEQQERVILFAASTNDSDDTEESVEELKELVKTAGAETVGTVIQNRENIHPGTCQYACGRYYRLFISRNNRLCPLVEFG